MRADTETGLTRSPRWHDMQAGLPHSVHDEMPAPVRGWITLASSMTQALGHSVGANVNVHLLRDGAGTLVADEAALLGANLCRGFVREVVLQADGRSLLAARTVHASLPLHRQLASLGARPLGELLFAAGEPCRLRQQYALLTPRMALFALVRQVQAGAREPCWARRVLYLFDRHSLLVTEIFLAAMLQRSSVQPQTKGAPKR